MLHYRSLAMELMPARLERAFTWLGGAAFVSSLALAAYVFLVRWGHGSDGEVVDWSAVWLNTAAFTVFAAHHSAFARTGVKAALARTLPDRLLRSVYVWIASGLFMAVMAWWQPIGGVLYHVTGNWAVGMALVQASGVLLTAVAVRAIDALDLAGIRQAPVRQDLQVRGPYRLVRHPLYLGWVLVVFGTAHMTGDRALFAGLSTLYLIIAIPWEERSLRAAFGDAYARYAARVRWRILPWVY
jgi:protein-S-isoprenylcysteine O-methyltransferase Ste14